MIKVQYYFIFLTLILFQSTISQAQSNKACSQDSLYLLLDYWIGEWEVYQSDTMVGTNRIEKILDGCAIVEHWEDSNGIQGKSLFYVDNNSRNWKQVWVTPYARLPGGQKEKVLQYSERDVLLIFQASYDYNGQRVLDRTLLKNLSTDLVLQTIQYSVDGGQNWNDSFIGEYRRK